MSSVSADLVSPSSVSIRCRVRKSSDPQKIVMDSSVEMNCVLRMENEKDHWDLLERSSSVSVPISPSESQFVNRTSDVREFGNKVVRRNFSETKSDISLNSTWAGAELLFLPSRCNDSPPKLSHEMVDNQFTRSTRLLSNGSVSQSITETYHSQKLPVRSQSPYPGEKHSSEGESYSKELSIHRRSTPRSRLQAASFFSVNNNNIHTSTSEYRNDEAFAVSVYDIVLVELVRSTPMVSSSVDKSTLYIETIWKEYLEIRFYKLEALELMHAYLCAMVPTHRRKIRVENNVANNKSHECPKRSVIVHDMANFEADAVEESFRNESYFDKLARQSTAFCYRIVDVISALSDCSIRCGEDAKQLYSPHQVPVSRAFGNDPIYCTDKLSLKMVLNDTSFLYDNSGLELQTSPTSASLL